jgi:hypothetical protein
VPTDLGPRKEVEPAAEREKLSISIPKDLIDWLDEMVEKRILASRYHGVELCILEGQRKYGQNEQ